MCDRWCRYLCVIACSVCVVACVGCVALWFGFRLCFCFVGLVPWVCFVFSMGVMGVIYGLVWCDPWL